MVKQTFDLALVKKLSNPSQVVVPGSDVKFIITLTNQGTLTATNVQVTDYIPAGMSLNDAAWTAVAGKATLNSPIGSISDNNGTATVSITLKVNQDFEGTKLVNSAEISGASNSLGQNDVDSTPDQNADNDAGGKEDSASDDVINGTGTGVHDDTNERQMKTTKTQQV